MSLESESPDPVTMNDGASTVLIPLQEGTVNKKQDEPLIKNTIVSRQIGVSCCQIVNSRYTSACHGAGPPHDMHMCVITHMMCTVGEGV